MIDESTFCVYALTNPIGFSKGGDEEADVFLKSDIDLFRHTLNVLLGAFFYEGVEANRLVREASNVADSFS